MAFKNLIILLITLFITWANAYCTAEKPSSTPLTNACDLITKDDVQNIFKEGIEGPQSRSYLEGTGSTSKTLCLYATLSDEPLRGISVTASAFMNATDALYQYQQTLKELVPAKELIQGIGDQAYWVPTMNQINIVKGDFQISITADAAKNQQSLETLKLLAEKALQKI